MFIDARRNQGRPPSGGSCQSGKLDLLYIHGPPDGGRAFRHGLYKHGPPDGGRAFRHGLYKHGPPDGGRAHFVTGSINMALLTEGGRISSRAR